MDLRDNPRLFGSGDYHAYIASAGGRAGGKAVAAMAEKAAEIAQIVFRLAIVSPSLEHLNVVGCIYSDGGVFEGLMQAVLAQMAHPLPKVFM